MSSLSPGDRLGPYVVVDALGQGGMGQVYRAHDRTAYASLTCLKARVFVDGLRR